MKHRTSCMGLALTAFILPALAHPCPAWAQQTSKDLVPFKAIAKGPFPTPFVIPWDPPIWGFNVTWPAESELLGPCTYYENSTAQIGVDGAPMSITNAIGALTAASGDAIFFRFSGLVYSTATGGGCDHRMVIVGGKGRFAGATGSGTIKGESDLAKNVGTLTFDGTISRPAAKPQ